MYLDIYQAIVSPPQLLNIDGEPIVLHNLVFDITSPQVAFQRLQPLAQGMSEEELLNEAEFDETGELYKVELHWLIQGASSLSDTKSTALGRITIEDRELRVFVNSQKRAQRIRKEIEERLGTDVTFKSMAAQNIEESMQHESASLDENTEPEITPEEKAIYDKAIDQMYDEHWQKWVDMDIPALNDKTPRQAVNDADGREKVIALLNDAERTDKKSSNEISQLKFIRRTRKQLGIE